MTVRLEPWAEDDLPLLQGLLGDPAMMEHLGGPEAPDKIVERHGRYLGNPGALKITVDGVPAGWVGFWEHEWEGETIYEMGWSVLPAFQGRGVASAGTRLALQAARASDGPRSVHAFPPPGNAASNAVCRKCGFTFVGEVPFEYPKGHWGASNDWVIDLDRMTIDEARLEDVGSGLAPVTPGWFVVNAGEAAWVRNDAFGGRCVFESSPRVLAERPDAQPQFFPETGFTLAVLEPGKPSGMYHAESTQEDFLVLAGTCLLLIEDQERELRPWDFVHLPPGTRHTFVGTGDGPCAIFMTGARREGDTIVYPRSEQALAHGAGVERETPDPGEAYEHYPSWRLGRPDTWPALPWG